MGTFIVAFIGNGFVGSAQKSTALGFFNSRPIVRRRLLVLLYFSSIVSVVFLFGVMTIPDIIREGADFVRRLKSENVWMVVLEKMRNGLGYEAHIQTLMCSLFFFPSSSSAYISIRLDAARPACKAAAA